MSTGNADFFSDRYAIAYVMGRRLLMFRFVVVAAVWAGAVSVLLSISDRVLPSVGGVAVVSAIGFSLAGWITLDAAARLLVVLADLAVGSVPGLTDEDRFELLRRDGRAEDLDEGADMRDRGEEGGGLRDVVDASGALLSEHATFYRARYAGAYSMASRLLLLRFVLVAAVWSGALGLSLSLPERMLSTVGGLSVVLSIAVSVGGWLAFDAAARYLTVLVDLAVSVAPGLSEEERLAFLHAEEDNFAEER